jgi:hypothetical protein
MIKINGATIGGDPDAQVALGNVTGGHLVQNGHGSQVAISNVTGGDLIQSGGED